MRGVVVPIDGAINRLTLPMKAVAVSELQRKPDVDEATVSQVDTEFIGPRHKGPGHDIRIFDSGNLGQAE